MIGSENNMKITVLDAATLGDDISLERFNELGDTIIYQTTPEELIVERIADCDVIVANKVKLNATNLDFAKNLKLICITATGYDNVDTSYCKSKNIAVCNVKGYSTDSVSQVTVATVLSLYNHIAEYDRYVKDGSYTSSGVQNCLTPVYRELSGKTWGIIGLGNIGKQVAKVATALGCNVIAYKRKKTDEYRCVTLSELMWTSDIITIHLPLSDETKNIVNKSMISLMKPSAVIVNAARGAVWDEESITKAIIDRKIGAMGCDVYSIEPMKDDHPFSKLVAFDNVCLLPHMSWGAYEARNRCLDEVAQNIKSFFNNEIRNRVDI